MDASIIIYTPTHRIFRSFNSLNELKINEIIKETENLLPNLEEIINPEILSIEETLNINNFSFKRTDGGAVFLKMEEFTLKDRIVLIEKITLLINYIPNENIEDIVIGIDQIIYFPFKSMSSIIELLIMESYNESVNKENAENKKKEIQQHYEEIKEKDNKEIKDNEIIKPLIKEIEVNEKLKRRECPKFDGITIKENIKIFTKNSLIKSLDAIGTVTLFKGSEKDYNNIKLDFISEKLEFSPYILKDKLPNTICLRDGVPLNKQIIIARYINFKNYEDFPIKISIWRDEKYLLEIINDDIEMDFDIKFNGLISIENEEIQKINGKCILKGKLESGENRLIEISGSNKEIFPLRFLMYRNKCFSIKDNIENIKEWVEIDWKIENDE